MNVTYSSSSSSHRLTVVYFVILSIKPLAARCRMNMSSTRPHVKNCNVSGAVLTRAERCEIAKLSVKLEKSSHGNFTASVWKYFGELWYGSDDSHGISPGTSTSVSNLCIDKEGRYCLLCLEREQKLYAAGQGNAGHGHISRVKKYSRNTSTGTLADHLFTVHEVDVRSTGPTATKRQLSIEQTLAAATGNKVSAATTQHEMNRDMCLMLCTDLLPFSVISGIGFKNFFAKNFPDVRLPCESTLKNTALYDLYSVLKDDVKKLLADVVADQGTVSLMFDGWTDRYHGRPYLGLRVAFIHPETWQSHVKTLSVKVLESHTGQSLANHIQMELDEFGIGDRRKCSLYSTHDGAANMMKCSRLLQVTDVVHCLAHSIHLLLTVDSAYRIPTIGDVIKKCKEVVTGLHFKGCAVEDASLSDQDREKMNELTSKIEQAMESVLHGERISDGVWGVDDDDDDDYEQLNESPTVELTTSRHVHRTLKQEVQTR